MQFALMDGYKLYLSLFRMNINYTFFYSANLINTSILKIN